MDEWDELSLVARALVELTATKPGWSSNYYAFGRMTPPERYRWWQLAKRQADKGLPSMQQLVLEVIKLRMQT